MQAQSNIEQDQSIQQLKSQIQQSIQMVTLTNGTVFMNELLSEIQKRQKQGNYSILMTKGPGNSTSVDFSEIKQQQTIPIKQIQQKILKIFTRCTFFDIQYIYIWGTNVNNSEFMQFMDCPKLKNVYFSNNKITSFKPLVKANIPNIEILNIQGNFERNLSLQRFKLPNISESFVIQFQDEGWIMIQDLSKLVKLQAQFYDRFRLQIKSRVKQPKVRQVIKQKFRLKKQTNQTRIIQLL